jgi:purine-binding chemotaxis protein CheW
MTKQHAHVDWVDVHRRVRSSEHALEKAIHPGEEATRELLARRARVIAQPRASVAAAADLVLLTFRIGRERLGLPLCEVVEVGALKHCTPVPGAAAEVCGVISHLGEIRTVMDGSRLLGIESSVALDKSFLMYITAAAKRLILRVDSIEQTIEAASDKVTLPETFLGSTPRRYVRGVLANGLVVLDGSALCGAPGTQRFTGAAGFEAVKAAEPVEHR